MKLKTLLNCALLTVALAVVVLCGRLFLEGYSHILFADSWVVLMDFKAANFQVTPAQLLGFHSEHRPLFARLPILADTLWAGGRGYVPFTLIFLTQAAHAWLLTFIARKQTWFQISQLPLVVALAVFCCFSPAQMENFIWSFQTAFVLNFFFATAGAAAVAAQKENQSPKWIAAVFICACGAPLCLASGVFVWWIVIAMSIALRLPRKWIVIYTAAAVLTMLLYVQGYKQPPGHNSPLDALRQPLGVLHYIAYFLGASWKWWTMGFGELLALAASVLLGFRIVSFIRARPTNPWEMVPLAVMLFSLGTGFLAALGRLNFGLDQAGSSRYQTPALLFWFMTALLVLQVLSKQAESVRLAFAGFVLLAMLSVFPASTGAFALVRDRRMGWEQAEAAWVSGVQDTNVINAMIAGNQLELYWPYRERHLGLFSVEPGAELGTIVSGDRIQGSNYCAGQFSRDAYFLGKEWPGIRLRGNAHLSSDLTPIREFITTTLDRRVVGVGVDGVVYASVKTEKEPLIVYGLLDHGKVCAVSTD